MKTSTIRLGIAGLLIALVGLLGALHLHQRQGELRQREQSLRDELAAIQQQRRALRSAQTRVAPTAPAATPAATPLPAAPAPPPTNLARGSRVADALRTLPEYEPFEQRRLRRSTLRRYGELFTELKLAPAREEALKKIFDERLSEGMKALTTAYQQGHNQTSPEYARLQNQVMAASAAKLAALLSAEEQAVCSRYEKSVIWRSGQQHELDEFVADRGLSPLSATQKQALAAAYYEARNWQPDPAEGKLTYVTMERRRYEQMAKIAARTLDPKHHAGLSAYLEFNHARGEIAGRLFYPGKPPGSVFLTSTIQRP